MMYMPDTLKAILDLMDADVARISVRTSYNITAVSFSAEELVAEIQQHLPDFTCAVPARLPSGYRRLLALGH